MRESQRDGKEESERTRSRSESANEYGRSINKRYVKGACSVNINISYCKRDRSRNIKQSVVVS